MIGSLSNNEVYPKYSVSEFENEDLKKVAEKFDILGFGFCRLHCICRYFEFPLDKPTMEAFSCIIYATFGLKEQNEEWNDSFYYS